MDLSECQDETIQQPAEEFHGQEPRSNKKRRYLGWDVHRSGTYLEQIPSLEIGLNEPGSQRRNQVQGGDEGEDGKAEGGGESWDGRDRIRSREGRRITVGMRLVVTMARDNIDARRLGSSLGVTSATVRRRDEKSRSWIGRAASKFCRASETTSERG